MLIKGREFVETVQCIKGPAESFMWQPGVESLKSGDPVSVLLCLTGVCDLDEVARPPSFSFLVFQPGLVIPALQNCCGDWMRKCLGFLGILSK